MTVCQRRGLLIFGWVFASVAVAGPAFAQGPTAPLLSPKIFAGVGFGSMNPVHGDDNDEGSPVLVSLGIRTTPRGWIEVEVTRRTWTNVNDATNVILPITVTPPTGTVGRADRVTFTTKTSDLTVGVQAIARGQGAVAVFGGGGFLLHRDSERRQRQVVNCVPPSASPNALSCREFDDRESGLGAGVAGLGGVDVKVTSRLHVSAAVRYEWRHDLGMGTFGFTAGVRVPLR